MNILNVVDSLTLKMTQLVKSINFVFFSVNILAL